MLRYSCKTAMKFAMTDRHRSLEVERPRREPCRRGWLRERANSILITIFYIPLCVCSVSYYIPISVFAQSWSHHYASPRSAISEGIRNHTATYGATVIVNRRTGPLSRMLSVSPCVAFLWCCVCYFPHPHCVLLPSPAACATSLPRSLCYFPHPDGLSLRRPLASGSLSPPVMHTCNWRGCVHSCAYHAPIMRPLRRLPRHHCRAPYLRRCSLVSHI